MKNEESFFTFLIFSSEYDDILLKLRYIGSYLTIKVSGFRLSARFDVESWDFIVRLLICFIFVIITRIIRTVVFDYIFLHYYELIWANSWDFCFRLYPLASFNNLPWIHAIHCWSYWWFQLCNTDSHMFWLIKVNINDFSQCTTYRINPIFLNTRHLLPAVSSKV